MNRLSHQMMDQSFRRFQGLNFLTPYFCETLNEILNNVHKRFTLHLESFGYGRLLIELCIIFLLKKKKNKMQLHKFK